MLGITTTIKRANKTGKFYLHIFERVKIEKLNNTSLCC